MYQSNLQRILTQIDYNNINTELDNLSNTFVKLYTGHYSGNQNSGTSNPSRYISIGTNINAVLVYNTSNGFDNYGSVYGGLALNGVPSKNKYVSISGNGFYVQNSQHGNLGYDGCNISGNSYSYIAF